MNEDLLFTPGPGERILIIEDDYEMLKIANIREHLSKSLQRIRPQKKPEPKIITLSQATNFILDQPEEFPICNLIILIGNDFYDDKINLTYYLNAQGLYQKMAIITSSQLYGRWISENTKNFPINEATLHDIDENRIHQVALDIFSWYNNTDLTTVG